MSYPMEKRHERAVRRVRCRSGEASLTSGTEPNWNQMCNDECLVPIGFCRQLATGARDLTY